MEDEQEKKVVVPKRTADIQRYKVEKLMKNPDKPVFIPEKREEKEPRVFNPPEFIRNIWGSSAGVGSGDFHIYRNMRRRQYAREKYTDFKSEKERLDAEYQDKLLENVQKAYEKTAKKRAKRLKKKQKNKKSKVIKDDDKSETSEEESEKDSDCEQNTDSVELKTQVPEKLTDSVSNQ